MGAAISHDTSKSTTVEDTGFMALKLTFAFNLRRLMRLHNVQAKDFAEKIGVSASMVTHWRNGDAFPQPDNIEKICEAFAVEYTELFRRDTDPNPHARPNAQLRAQAEKEEIDP
jgi:transcriptional regulator with XRE-family HTH domain